jgi:PIN domain nuclease of toxin-antitoxin system
VEAGSLVYLDTCTVLWLYAGLDEKITPAARMAIEAGSLRVCPIVLLEIQYLYEAGRFTHRPEDVTDELGKLIGLSVCDLSFTNVALAAARIDWTREPFDRLITAHARCQQAALVTADQNILKHYERAIW